MCRPPADPVSMGRGSKDDLGATCLGSESSVPEGGLLLLTVIHRGSFANREGGTGTGENAISKVYMNAY